MDFFIYALESRVVQVTISFLRRSILTQNLASCKVAIRTCATLAEGQRINCRRGIKKIGIYLWIVTHKFTAQCTFIMLSPSECVKSSTLTLRN